MSEWKETRLKSLLSSPLTYGLNVSAEDDREDFPRYIRITDFDDYNNLRDETFKSLPMLVAKSAFLEEGDLLFARSGATVGKTFLYSALPHGACYAGYLIRARFNKKIALPKYVSYFTKGSCYSNWKERYCIQTTIQNISAERYNQLPLRIPPLAEQQSIVDYLDKKIAAIDLRVEVLKKQKKAYARLKKSVINQAVTRGLNPNVSLKGSGIDWIGLIPEHWVTKRFKDTYKSANVGESIDKEYNSDDASDKLFYTAGVEPIHTKYELFPQWKYTTSKDILLARNGTPYVYLPICNSVYSDHIIRVDIKRDFCKEYVRYCVQQAISNVVVDTVSITTWSISIWNRLLIPQPPLSEQKAIADYLDEKCAKIDAAMENIEKQIKASDRLKKAIINEAISGNVIL